MSILLLMLDSLFKSNIDMLGFADSFGLATLEPILAMYNRARKLASVSQDFKSSPYAAMSLHAVKMFVNLTPSGTTLPPLLWTGSQDSTSRIA